VSAKRLDETAVLVYDEYEPVDVRACARP